MLPFTHAGHTDNQANRGHWCDKPEQTREQFHKVHKLTSLSHFETAPKGQESWGLH